MAITNGQNADASDFIDESEKDATPANDEGRVAKLENDGKLHPFFVRNGAQLLCGETLNGGSTPVPVYQNKSDNELYACDANDLTKLKFIGFVITNGTNGNPARFQGAGVVGGFTGLAEGEKYYVQDTVGTIGTSPGTYEILVGVAISQTELLIQKGRRRAAGVLSLSDQGADENTSTQTMNLGFRPSVIRVLASLVQASSGDRMENSGGVWLNGVYASWYMSHTGVNSAEDTETNKIARVGPSSGTEGLYYITIGNVTDTGFDFSILQKEASPTSAALIWEAEGEL